MRLTRLMLALALLAGCKQQPQRTPKFSDAQMQAARIVDPGMTEDCLNKLKWGGVEALPDRADQCYKFDRARRWKGLWINAFEGSLFCLSPRQQSCPQGGEGNSAKDIWLDFAVPGVKRPKPGGVYEVEFIGRRSDGAGNFGHGGVYSNEIIVDRMISMKVIEAPPKD